MKHAMIQTLSMVLNEHREDWDEHSTTHVQSASNNWVGRVSDLAPNKVHLGWHFGRLPLTIFQPRVASGYQSLEHDRLEHIAIGLEIVSD